MESNLLSIINFINDNIKFGSELHIENVFDMFNKFAITNVEKQRVWEELDSLNIKLIYPERLSKKEVLELLTAISWDKKIYKTDLIDWFYKENIAKEKQEQIFQILYSSNYLIINDKTEDHSNLSSLIFYLESNIRYGSNLKMNTIFNLFQKYSIPDSKKKFVWKDLESLNVRIIDDGKPLEKTIMKLLESIDTENKFYNFTLNNWFDTEKIEISTLKRIKHLLKTLGYGVIVEETFQNSELKDQTLIEEQDDYNLDDLLNDNDFKKNVMNLQDTVNKNNNNEYLNDYINSDIEIKRDNAIDSLVKANQNLVISIVKKYSKFSSVAFDLEDMFQAGMIGLIKAANKFDLKIGTQFSTYAIYWINQCISRSIANFSTTIRIPVHIREKISKYIKIENEYFNRNGRLATDDDISKIFRTSKNKIKKLKSYKNLSRLTRIEDLVTGDSTLGQFLMDPDTPSPEYVLEQKELKKEIDSVISKVLTDREILIIKLRYGFVDGKVYTLESIGNNLNLTRERIRQIQAKAINKLKMNKTLKELYYD
ncbi:sigma-70 family RNA polymerase sigma factor [Lactobacillus sp. W8089]|nr:sigma-70 family RNA polymerase sigma factor [Lactobacillus sp. W8086]MBI0108648.1 sigma-70 family RNA polymerase sigma factor [Lactobacillus sp. W8085]MBI0111865.1 sigma-70 family RNA polymerase sigma factor [Lactobacillus sp. W8088]MBI0115581.1 sigma-70 family RNA polymerase sigma factor [Lactobacillus sp. W8087]MBI0119305.1 sigma-70 family RNA polymerase sigma factor [Lactobacillus sp. W8089]MBI0131271.1 sigma-70 family RNA polymerase sigma factor [Lactobacillus sp. W8090]